MESLLHEGVELAILGMGTVFLFLTLLVLMTTLMSRFILAFEPVLDSQTELGNPRLIAAITAAVQQFRSDHKHL